MAGDEKLRDSRKVRIAHRRRSVDCLVCAVTVVYVPNLVCLDCLICAESGLDCLICADADLRDGVRNGGEQLRDLRY